MTHRLAAVLSPAEFPVAELAAMRLDGDVYAIDDCASPIDELCTPGLRAAALAALLPPRLIVEQLSAAWVWGALASAPSVQQLCADIGARARPTGPNRMTIREVVIDADDVATLSGIRVTTPMRTAIDMARFRPCFEEADRKAVAFLMQLGGVDLSGCVASMSKRRNLPNKKLAITRLAQCSPQCSLQPELTR